MKKYLFYCLFFIAYTLLIDKANAQNIQTGNARAKSTVETNIQGSGSVTTHIEVEANGEKKVLDENKPGSYSLSVESDNNSKASSDASLNVSSATSPGTADIDSNKNRKTSFIANLLKDIQNFFKKLFNFL